MNKTNILIIVVVLGLGIAMGAWNPLDDHGSAEEGHGHETQADGHGHDQASEVVQVPALSLSAAQIEAAGIEWVQAGPRELANTFTLPGEIRFDEDRTAHVVPRASGVVESVNVSLGQAVKRGDLLAVIASPQISEQRSELAASHRRLELARITFERERQLWQEQISPEQDYLQARQALQEAEIAQGNAQQKMSALSGGVVMTGGNRYELRAPFTGVVVEKHLVPGEVVSEASSAFTVSDLSSVWATFGVSPKDLGKVRVGESVRIRALELGQQVSGTISYVGSLLGEQTRTASVRVTLANPEDAWRPGLFVEVQLATDRQRAAVVVPEQAVQTLENTPTVFIRNPEGFAPQPVVLGIRENGFVEIREGLKANQWVVSAGSFILKSELGKAEADHAH